MDLNSEFRSCEHFSQVLPSVEPGFLQKQLPNEAPEKSEDWKTVMEDLNDKIMPGITHWQSNNFHAYYPSQTSAPSIIGDMIANGLGIVSFSWVRRIISNIQLN